MQGGIFVSYSHKDLSVVEGIVSVLKEKSGQEVWIDKNLRGGDDYLPVIVSKIKEYDYFLFAVSEDSVGSKWCKDELKYAHEKGKRIIAVWLEDVALPDDIEFIIHKHHYVYWYSSTEQQFERDIERAFCGKEDEFFSQEITGEQNDAVTKNEKYFLTESQIKQLQKLLDDEKNERYSVCFEPENANLLGIAYELGIKVEQDLKKAALYYKASEHAGNLDGQYLYFALKRQQEPEVDGHLEKMLDAAEKGSVIALTNVGDDYYNGGNGLPLDKAKAFEYFECAAKAGGITAMYYTAFCYNSGNGIDADYELAYMYALKAKENDFPRAYRLIAYMYEFGHYFEADYDKAIKMYEEAIRRGDYLCYCYAGYLYGEKGQIDKKIELYQKAVGYANEGKIKSGSPFYRMAIAYDDGTGVEQNYDIAAEYYLKAAERKYKKAFEHWTVDCILKTAEERRRDYLFRAFELKCKNAAYELGRIEQESAGGDEESFSDSAIKYFEAGAENGDAKCIEVLAMKYSWVFVKDEKNWDSTNAKKWLDFLLSNINKDNEKSFCEIRDIEQYYYAYAVELEIDPTVNEPDRDKILDYLIKAIYSPPIFKNVMRFGVNHFLFPRERGSKFAVDVPHTEELLKRARNMLNSYRDIANEKKKPEIYEEYIEMLNSTKETMAKAYRFISKCYETGENVPQRDMEKAKKYKDLEIGLMFLHKPNPT